eukprot:4125907-Prymnesium_polylepis.2
MRATAGKLYKVDAIDHLLLDQEDNRRVDLRVARCRAHVRVMRLHVQQLIGRRELQRECNAPSPPGTQGLRCCRRPLPPQRAIPRVRVLWEGRLKLSRHGCGRLGCDSFDAHPAWLAC